MKYLHFILLLGFSALLFAATFSLPPRGRPDAPVHQVTSPAGTQGAGSYYTRYAGKDAATPNMVTVVLADYRGFDTLGETIVVFTAGMACALILRKSKST